MGTLVYAIFVCISWLENCIGKPRDVRISVEVYVLFGELFQKLQIREVCLQMNLHSLPFLTLGYFLLLLWLTRGPTVYKGLPSLAQLPIPSYWICSSNPCMGLSLLLMGIDRIIPAGVQGRLVGGNTPQPFLHPQCKLSQFIVESLRQSEYMKSYNIIAHCLFLWGLLSNRILLLLLLEKTLLLVSLGVLLLFIPYWQGRYCNERFHYLGPSCMLYGA